MKRDMDVTRDILLAIENSDQPELRDMPVIDGQTPNIVAEHIRLLVEAGYLTAIDCSSMDDNEFMQMRLTWRGHDLVGTIRDPEIWRQTKGGASRIGSWTISMLAELAKGYAKQKAIELGLPLA